MMRSRKLNRLKDYDYAKEGFYFVTVCVKDRVKRFGEVKDGRMMLNEYGEMVNRYGMGIPGYYKDVALDEFVVMPNHIHGIIIIGTDVGTEHCSVPTVLNVRRNFIRFPQ